MFSISTMASSTRIPITRVRASRVTMFSEKPPSSITKKVGISEIGTASAGDHRRAPVAQEQEHHQGRQDHPLGEHMLGGAEALRGFVHRGEDLGELHAGVRLLQAPPAWLSQRPRPRRRWPPWSWAIWKPTTGRPSSARSPAPPRAPSPTSTTSENLTKPPFPVGISRWRSWSSEAGRARGRGRSARVRRPPPARREHRSERRGRR